jgi:hypothetical protein
MKFCEFLVNHFLCQKCALERNGVKACISQDPSWFDFPPNLVLSVFLW